MDFIQSVRPPPHPPYPPYVNEQMVGEGRRILRLCFTPPLYSRLRFQHGGQSWPYVTTSTSGAAALHVKGQPSLLSSPEFSLKGTNTKLHYLLIIIATLAFVTVTLTLAKLGSL